MFPLESVATLVASSQAEPAMERAQRGGARGVIFDDEGVSITYVGERDIAESDSAARERAYGYEMACGVGGEGRNAVKVGLAGAGSPKEVALGVVNGQEGVGAEGAAGRASQRNPS
jgi:hypothetical protein